MNVLLPAVELADHDEKEEFIQLPDGSARARGQVFACRPVVASTGRPAGPVRLFDVRR